MKHDEQCCVLDDSGTCCKNPSEFWVGANSIDDYTYACAAHLDAVKRDDDTVVALEP